MTQPISKPGAAFDWEALKRGTAAALDGATTPEQIERVFADRARALAQDPTRTANAAYTSLFGFVHAGLSLAVEIGAVLRILRARRSTRVPGAPAHLAEVFYEAGRIVSVADVSLLFGRSPCPSGEDQIVLLEGGKRWLGIRAQEVLGPLNLELSKLSSPSPGLDARIARAVRGVGEDMTVVLDGAELVETLRD